MRKFYILFALLIPFVAANAQFQLRLTQPGDGIGFFNVQIRSVDANFLPTTDDLITDLSFRIWWNDPAVVDIDVVQANTYMGYLTEGNPAIGLSGGNTGTSGNVVPIAFCGSGCDPAFFPNNWVANEWITIATVFICSVNNCGSGNMAPAGVDASDFLIQSPYQFFPNFGYNFTDFTPNQAPLPLSLVGFEANKSGEKNAFLNWVTANEENTSHFTVQRSLNLSKWSDVGTIDAAGYSVDIRNYSIMDYDVYNGTDARLKVHYRLVMVDRDGRTTISPIKSVVYGKAQSSREVLVYPNPASQGVYVEWGQTEFNNPTSLEFYDINGKLVLTQNVAENSTQEYVDFTISTMIPGLYLLRVISGTEVIDNKQIIIGQR